MTTSIDIANLALSAVGTRSTIASFDEETPEANACAIWYDTTRQQIFRMARWGFARAYVNLAVLKAAPGTPENPNGVPTTYWNSANPPPPWLYEYAYPADCLLANYVVAMTAQGNTGIPIFSAGNTSPVASTRGPVQSVVTTDIDSGAGSRIKCICTNQRQATLCYITDVTDCDLWDQGFQQSVIYGLAGAIAIALTGDKALANNLMKLANQNIALGRQMNANENLSQQDTIPSWIQARDSMTTWIAPGTTFLDQLAPYFAVIV